MIHGADGKPIAVTGPSGIGKSSLISKVTETCSKDMTMLSRFIGHAFSRASGIEKVHINGIQVLDGDVLDRKAIKGSGRALKGEEALRKDIKERISRLLAACLLFFLCIIAIARYYYVVNDAVVLGKMPCFCLYRLDR